MYLLTLADVALSGRVAMARSHIDIGCAAGTLRFGTDLLYFLAAVG
jgi:hypothetical protein